MTSHYTRGFVTTLNDLEGVLGWHLDTFFGPMVASVQAYKCELVSL